MKTDNNPVFSSESTVKSNNEKIALGQVGNPNGRKKGSKNKRTLAVLEACRDKDFDPLR